MTLSLLLAQAKGLGEARLVLLGAVADEAARVRAAGGPTAALVELARVALAMRSGWTTPPKDVRHPAARALARAWVVCREEGPEAGALALLVSS
jgi:hypothetical protein